MISIDITISVFLLMFIGTICQTQICPKECMCKNEFEVRIILMLLPREIWRILIIINKKNINSNYS